MNNSKTATQKHMTLDDRISIEKGLDQHLSLRSIALQLGKDPTTISKEIKKHRSFQEHNRFNEPANKCALAKDCKKKNICGTYAPVCKRMCRSCNHCNSHCEDFIPRSYHCSLLDKAPFVCNGCSKKNPCRLDKAYYRSSTAHRQYKTILVESRAGINISPADLVALDELVTPLILQGQSPYMILRNHPEIALSEKTLYNYIESGALSVKNIDLPKKVKYKVRSCSSSEAADLTIYEGRTYKDYQAFLKEFPDTRVTEMDTVLGCEGSKKVLLTLHFDCCSLMMAYLLDSKEVCHVKAIFDSIERSLGTFSFSSVFSLVLTDRGGEFRNPAALECGQENLIRTSIYYCDPMCSWQKPHCEKNHEYIRKICPKGTSFDDYSQEDITLMMSHINSSPRQSLGGMSPLKLAKLMLPSQVIDYFGLTEIPDDEIVLTPALLQKQNQTLHMNLRIRVLHIFSSRQVEFSLTGHDSSCLISTPFSSKCTNNVWLNSTLKGLTHFVKP